MNHDALVQRGRLPWSPNGRVSDLDIWHQYEHPLVGTFRCERDIVFFAQVVGFDSRVSLWAYTCLTSQEAQAAQSAEFDSPDDLRRCAHNLLSGRKIVLALADDQLTEHWSVSDKPCSLVEQATTFLDHVLTSVSPRQDPETRLRAKLAQVDVATAELVDA